MDRGARPDRRLFGRRRGGAARPQQTALSIVWTPEAPAAGQSVRFSLGGDVSNVRSVLWMFGDGKTSSAAAGGEVDMPMPLPETTR